MSIKRFYGKGTAVGGWVELSKEEQGHARVARLREGEAAELIDGAGNFWRGVFEKNGVRVNQMGHAEPSNPKLILAIGITQGGTMDDIVRQATEMGVAEIIPLKSKNSAPLGKDKGREENKVERWQRIAEEACKQCGLYWKPNVWPATSLGEVLLKNSQSTHIVAALEEPITPWDKVAKAKESMIVWIGPEGGFSKEEHDQLRKTGAVFVSLGKTILRAETACVAALARASLLC